MTLFSPRRPEYPFVHEFLSLARESRWRAPAHAGPPRHHQTHAAPPTPSARSSPHPLRLRHRHQRPRGAAAPGGADPAEVEVVDEWARALSEGDVEGAAAYFAIPSFAQNGPQALPIRDREDALLFNRSLPCGAELIRATDHAGFVIATFRLGERPGPGECGPGTGTRARTAFRIEDGKIAEWRRVPAGAPEGEPLPSDVV